MSLYKCNTVFYVIKVQLFFCTSINYYFGEFLEFLQDRSATLHFYMTNQYIWLFVGLKKKESVFIMTGGGGRSHFFRPNTLKISENMSQAKKNGDAIRPMRDFVKSLLTEGISLFDYVLSFSFLLLFVFLFFFFFFSFYPLNS